MKIQKFFVALLFLSGCMSQAEDEVDLDEMVLLEDELEEKTLAGEPLESPQEVLIKESPNAQY